MNSSRALYWSQAAEISRTPFVSISERENIASVTCNLINVKALEDLEPPIAKACMFLVHHFYTAAGLDTRLLFLECISV